MSKLIESHLIDQEKLKRQHTGKNRNSYVEQLKPYADRLDKKEVIKADDIDLINPTENKDVWYKDVLPLFDTIAIERDTVYVWDKEYNLLSLADQTDLKRRTTHDTIQKVLLWVYGFLGFGMIAVLTASLLNNDLSKEYLFGTIVIGMIVIACCKIADQYSNEIYTDKIELYGSIKNIKEN